MRSGRLPHLAVAFAAFLSAFPVRGEEPIKPRSPDAPSRARSVTVFPIVLGSGAPLAGVSADMSKNVAQLVGLLLERGGMPEIEIADAEFSPPKEADLAKLAAAFGRFVQSQNLKTEYALFGQFLGIPGKGVDEIRLAVVDRQGKVVLAERLDQQQLMLRRMLSGEKKVDLMRASYSMVGRLRGLWGLADPGRKDAPLGKMARLWSEKSGLPPKNERESIEPRLKTLKKSIQTSTVAVYPVRVSGKSDPPLAPRLAQLLTKAGLGQAEASSTDPKLQIQGNTNQTRVLWDLARAFQNFCAKIPRRPTMPCWPITASAARPRARRWSAACSSSFATAMAIGSC